MHLKKQIILLTFLIFTFVSSMANSHFEADNSTIADTLKIKKYFSDHISLTDSVVNYGKIFLNTPYHFGSPGISSFDCSGFTSYVYRNFGYNLEHSSADQSKQFDTIDRSQLKPGDLVFFSGSRRSKRVGHVGIVTVAKENGEFDFIHAASHKGVTISNSAEPYYTRRFVKASRVIGSNQMLAISKFVPMSTGIEKETLRITPVAVPAQTIRKVIPAEYHRVKSGETLSSISKKYGISVEELKRKNNIKGSKLSLKQSIKIKDEESVMLVQAVQPKPDNTLAVVENADGNRDASKVGQSKAIAQNVTSHSVKKGETLFSISKIYNISIDELKKINNIIKEKIHPGQHIKISQPVPEPRTETLAKVEEAPKMSTHKVQSGESLFSIAKEYKVSVDDLKRLNNITNENIHAGQEIKLNHEPEIKKQYAAEIKPEEKQESKIKNTEKTITYKIKSGENLISIAKENNTTVEELKRMNNLADTKIHAGQELKIKQDVDARNQNALAEKKEAKKQGSKIENNEKILTHVIKKGENLGGIAKANNMSVDELMRINNLTSNKIHQGQELKINEVANEKDQSVIAEKSVNKKQDTKIKSNEKTLTHVIKKGENLGSIAKANKMSVDELMKINNLTSNKIHQGQELKINQVADEKDQPVLAEKSANKKQDAKIKSNEKTLTHVIKKGENLGSIAKANNMTVDELMRINNLASNKIHQGQELKINQGGDEKSQVVVVEKTDKKQELKAGNSGKASIHKIQKGESLISIAKDNNLSVDELKKINNMTDNKIRFGQELKLSQVAVKEFEPVSKVVNESKTIQHKVKSGESFYTIAKKYGCTVEDLKRWNRMTGSKIKAGDNVSINQLADN